MYTCVYLCVYTLCVYMCITHIVCLHVYNRVSAVCVAHAGDIPPQMRETQVRMLEAPSPLLFLHCPIACLLLHQLPWHAMHCNAIKIVRCNAIVEAAPLFLHCPHFPPLLLEVLHSLHQSPLHVMHCIAMQCNGNSLMQYYTRFTNCPCMQCPRMHHNAMQ